MKYRLLHGTDYLYLLKQGTPYDGGQEMCVEEKWRCAYCGGEKAACRSTQARKG